MLLSLLSSNGNGRLVLSAVSLNESSGCMVQVSRPPLTFTTFLAHTTELVHLIDIVLQEAIGAHVLSAVMVCNTAGELEATDPRSLVVRVF